MKRLKPISTLLSPEPKAASLTGRSSVVTLPGLPSEAISATASPAKLSTLGTLRRSKTERILDFDIETVAAGFADPDWVPQKITCVAWSWVGSDTVESRVCGPEGIFGDPSARARMLEPLLEELRAADRVTGHNILRFDLPIVNAECLRLGLESLRPLLVEDTIRLVRTKGFKKGQDVIGRLLRVPAEKLALDWQAWQDAYDEDGWQTIRDRCEGDVMQHKLIRERMLERGWVKPARVWRP